MYIKNRIISLLSITCFSLLILSCHVNEAYALFGFGSSKKKISYPFPTDAKSFKNKALEVFQENKSSNLEEFKILIPNDWVKEDILKSIKSFKTFGTLNKDLVSEIVRYKSPFIRGDRATLVIKKAQLFHEISAKYWLERYMNLHNYLPLSKTIEKSNKEALASFTYIDQSGFSKKTKVRAIINGNIIMLVEFNVPADFEKSMAFLQDTVLDNFILINKVDDSIEKTQIINMSGAVDIKYPASWNIYKLDTNNLNNMVLQIHNLKEEESSSETSTINGLIEIATIKRSDNTNLSRELKLLKSRLEDSMEVHFDEVKELRQIYSDKRFLFSRYESYTAKRNDDSKINKEIHVAILGDEDWYIIAFLYTPMKSEDSYNWARNVQSFTSIVEGVF